MMYRNLALSLALNAVVMFVVMYVMIDDLGHFYVNLNNVYMTALMVAPMLIVMLLIMRAMYPNRRLNMGLIAGAVVLFAGFFVLVREQYPVGDVQFLRSMIPHHSGAILMCSQAQITDPEIQTLCAQIIDSQQSEIDQMQAILERLR